jgi:PAS domain S-box-containing protein
MLTSLRANLVVLVLIAALPVLGVYIADQLRERRAQQEAIASDALQSADLLAERLGHIVSAARALALAVGQLQEVRTLDREACPRRLRELRSHMPEFVGLGVVDTGGTVFCRSMDGPAIEVGDRPYFQQALLERRFVASGYIIGRAINRPSLVFAAPVLGEADEVLAVAILAFDLANVATLLQETDVPPGATVSMLDPEGIVVARIPELASSDERVRNDGVREAIRARPRGTTVATGLDGVERVYGFSPLPEPAAFHVLVGMPLAPALHQIDARMWWNLAVLAAIFTAAAALALVGGEFAIRRPLGALEALARRLAAGELSAQAQPHHRAIGEIGALTQSLHRMAGSLQERERELRASEELNRRILLSSRDCIKVLDLDGRLLAINERGLGYRDIEHEREAIGTSYLDFWQDPDRAHAEAAMAEALQNGVGRFLARFRTPSGEEMWWDEVITPIFDGTGSPERLLVVSRDVTDIKRAEARRELLLAELDHRVKNNFAAILALARQTLPPDEATAAFIDRIEAMSRAHDLLSRSDADGVDLESLLQAVLEVERVRLRPEGPSVRLAPPEAQRLAMAVHELASNATRHGALSGQDGQIDLEWQLLDGGSRLRLVWQERGGPGTETPAHTGFGFALLERGLSDGPGGGARLHFTPDGLRCTIELELSGAPRPVPAEPERPVAGPEEDSDDPLRGRQVLIVEDSALAAMQLERVVLEAGCRVLGPAARLDQARRLVDGRHIDAALLDVNLGGELVFPLAAQLRDAGVPFVFTTAYDSSTLPEDFRHRPCLRKPIRDTDLVATLKAVLADEKPVA